MVGFVFRTGDVPWAAAPGTSWVLRGEVVWAAFTNLPSSSAFAGDPGLIEDFVVTPSTLAFALMGDVDCWSLTKGAVSSVLAGDSARPDDFVITASDLPFALKEDVAWQPCSLEGDVA